MDHLKILIDCVQALYREKEVNYDLEENIDFNLKKELKDLSGLISTKYSKDILEVYDLKAESEINWFILQNTANYISSFLDQRVSKIIRAVQTRNKIVLDKCFEFVEISHNLKEELKETKINNKKLLQDKFKMMDEIRSLRSRAEVVDKPDFKPIPKSVKIE